MLNSRLNFAIYLGLLVLLTGCTGPYTPETLPDPHAMKDGPGLFSGKSGSFTLYSSDDQVNPDPEKETP